MIAGEDPGTFNHVCKRDLPPARPVALRSRAETWNYVGLTRALAANGLPTAKISIVTMSIPIRIDLLATGEYITAMPKSVADRYAVKVLPIELPVERWSVAAITLKRRTLSPAVARFVECAHDAARPLAALPTRVAGH